nr:hypothetical protein [uncultured Alistipes sp.]
MQRPLEFAARRGSWGAPCACDTWQPSAVLTYGAIGLAASLVGHPGRHVAAPSPHAPHRPSLAH